MKLAVIPDPSPVVIAGMRELLPDAHVFAPWAIPPWLATGPRRWRRFSTSRVLEHPHTALPGWSAIEVALKAWQRGRTDRRYRSLFVVRRVVSEMLARWLSRDSRVTVVAAPSLAAREIFARTDAETILLEDLPGLRQLHVDLERAASAHPDCRFLRRFRAPSSQIARQESEWVLADQIAVRGRVGVARHGSSRSINLGSRDADLEVVSTAVATEQREPIVVLAGLAAARHGSCEVLAALDAIPTMTVRIRVGEGAEPRELLEHPRVLATRTADVRGAAAVIAPSWVEAYPHELTEACRMGVPIVATARASGHVVREAVTTIAPGSSGELIDVLRFVLEGRSAEHRVVGGA